MIDRLSADPASWGAAATGSETLCPATGSAPAAVLVLVAGLVGLAVTAGPTTVAGDLGAVLVAAVCAAAPPHR